MCVHILHVAYYYMCRTTYVSTYSTYYICVHILLRVYSHTRFCRQGVCVCVVCVCVCVCVCAGKRQKPPPQARLIHVSSSYYTLRLINVSAYYYICVGIPVYGPQKGLQYPHIPNYEFSMYVSSYSCHYICVPILLHVCPHTIIARRTGCYNLLNMCPHTMPNICIRIKLHVCPRTTEVAAKPAWWYTRRVILLHMCPHTIAILLHVSAYYGEILLHMCPHTIAIYITTRVRILTRYYYICVLILSPPQEWL
jgi:hypothetical protein